MYSYIISSSAIFNIDIIISIPNTFSTFIEHPCDPPFLGVVAQKHCKYNYNLKYIFGGSSSNHFHSITFGHTMALK